MDNLLFNPLFAGLATVIVLVLAVCFAVSTFSDESPKKYNIFIFSGRMMIVASLFTLLIWLIFFILNVHTETVYDVDWKQVYTNESNIDITLELSSNDHFKAGSELGEAYSKLQVYSSTVGKITASDKSDAKETKSIRLSADDVITNGELSSNSKITKVEYRAVKGKRRTSLGHYGKVEKEDYDGEIRITVDSQEKSDELKKLFN